MRKADFLRKKHSRFLYRGFRINHKKNRLIIAFDFFVEPDIVFHPQLVVPNVLQAALTKMGEGALRNFAFHLGLIEIPSYWKAACSPEIVIEAGSLNSEQTNWWKDVFIKGMGQFFYENEIDFQSPDFLRFRIVASKISYGQKGPDLLRGVFQDRYLVPVGGGRDSVVSLELLRKKKKKFNAFLVNPTRAARQVVRAAGIRHPIIVERKIDPVLFKLNRMGYLNGHTPFTAVLSFLSLFCAALFDYRHIAFSNEKSANEGNLVWRATMINHQYSKSSEFERKFRSYYKRYLAPNLHYFSLLRPYGDLEISKMFARDPHYFSHFSSCNFAFSAGAKKAKGKKRKFRRLWCGECPKCLFVYMTLYPYLGKRQMTKIFGRDLFENKKLLPIMRSLIDPKLPKPFECVGTKEESRRAFLLSIASAKKRGEMPYLLRKIKLT